MPAKKILAANWKENPKTEAQALKLFQATSRVKRGAKTEVVICSPSIYLEQIAMHYKKIKNKKNLAIGAQDVFWEEKGPFTSEVGPKMLKSLGATYVIIGHSERRKWLHETDVMIQKKVTLALKDKLTVILCVGESLMIRERGVRAAEEFVKNQLKKDLAGIPKALVAKNVIVAYEPIWAIGTGKSDEPGDARRMARFIKKQLKTKVLYGGSVNKRNVRDFVQLKEVDGALVGGASVKADEFRTMISSIAHKN